MGEPVADVLAVIAQQLRASMKGDDHALGDLAEWLESGDVDPNTSHSVFQFILHLIEPYCSGLYVEKGTRRKVNNRILDREERSVLSREAYGHLLRLRDQGALDDLQLEIILNQIVGTRRDEIGLEEMKRIINLVLFHAPDGEIEWPPPGGEDELPPPH